MFNLIAQIPTDLGNVSLTDKGFTANYSSPGVRLAEIISSIISVFTIFAGLAFLFYFVIGAFTWITSSDNPETLNKAKNQMSTAIVGLFVTVTATAIVYVLGEVTGLKILNPAEIISNLIPK